MNLLSNIYTHKDKWTTTFRNQRRHTWMVRGPLLQHETMPCPQLQREKKVDPMSCLDKGLKRSEAGDVFLARQGWITSIWNVCQNHRHLETNIVNTWKGSAKEGGRHPFSLTFLGQEVGSRDMWPMHIMLKGSGTPTQNGTMWRKVCRVEEYNKHISI